MVAHLLPVYLLSLCETCVEEIVSQRRNRIVKNDDTFVAIDYTCNEYVNVAATSAESC
uniref:Uncharacterized protein n=1 Tax=Helianthus annuus TaxID=4232 RepID=A0A251T0D9_HELAN